MFKSLKLAFQSFKNKWQDYLAVSFIFSVIIFVGFLIGQLFAGLFIAYIVVMIPAIISLKFCAFQSYDKNQVEYKHLKIGFLTFFKSIKIYSIVVLKPISIGFILGTVIYSVFLSSAIEIASETIPGIVDALADSQTFIYTYEEMLQIEEVGKILNIGLITSLVIGYLTYFAIKLKRDFIPFLAFEMPVTSKRATDINSKILNKKYFQFFLNNLVVTLMFLIPIGGALLTAKGLGSNDVYSMTTIMLLSSLVFCLLAGPIAMIKQLNYIHSYKLLSKPFKEDFDNELRNVLKELEELQKKQ